MCSFAIRACLPLLSTKMSTDLPGKSLTVDRAQHFIRLLGWSSGDARDTDGTWLVTCFRDNETIIACAKSQTAAWNLALEQAGKVQRDDAG